MTSVDQKLGTESDIAIIETNHARSGIPHNVRHGKDSLDLPFLDALDTKYDYCVIDFGDAATKNDLSLFLSVPHGR